MACSVTCRCAVWQLDTYVTCGVIAISPAPPTLCTVIPGAVTVFCTRHAQPVTVLRLSVVLDLCHAATLRPHAR